MNPYEVLGLDKDANQEQIKAAHRKQAKIHHPDKHGGDATAFRAVQEAFELLNDPERRKLFDETGSTEREPDIETMLQQKALQCVSEMLQQMIIELGVDLSTTSLKKQALTFTQNQLMEHIEKQAKLETMLERLEQMRKRFSKKDGGNSPLHSMLDHHKAGIKGDLKAIEINIQLTERVRDFFKAYDYTTDPTTTFVRMISERSSSTSNRPFQSF